MPETKIGFARPNRNLTKKGVVVGQTDHVYDVSAGTVVFEEVLVTGDLSGEVDYNGRVLKVTRVDSIIGLEITPAGARGPVWKAVECEVVK